MSRTIEEIKALYEAATTLEEKINREHELKNELFKAYLDGRVDIRTPEAQVAYNYLRNYSAEDSEFDDYEKG